MNYDVLKNFNVVFSSDDREEAFSKFFELLEEGLPFSQLDEEVFLNDLRIDLVVRSNVDKKEFRMLLRVEEV